MSGTHGERSTSDRLRNTEDPCTNRVREGVNEFRDQVRLLAREMRKVKIQAPKPGVERRRVRC